MKSRKFSQCKYVSPRKINLTVSTGKYRYLDNSRMKRTVKLFPFFSFVWPWSVSGKDRSFFRVFYFTIIPILNHLPSCAWHLILTWLVAHDKSKGLFTIRYVKLMLNIKCWRTIYFYLFERICLYFKLFNSLLIVLEFLNKIVI